MSYSTIRAYTPQWQLHPAWFFISMSATPFSSLCNNHSLPQWPSQPTAGAAAWKWWHEILSVLYLKPQSHNLRKPLGLWHPDYDKDYHWGWWVFPHTWTLFQYNDGQWFAYSQYHRYPDYCLYQHHPSPSPKPTLTIPVTPDITSATIKIVLPVVGMATTQLMPESAKPLSTQLITPLDEWADTLWHNIWPHAHTDTLQSALLANLQILLLSDAAIHPDGTETCTWVI